MHTLTDIITPPPHADVHFGTTQNAQEKIDNNIRLLAEKLGPVAYMRQVHGTTLKYASKPGVYEEADALFTDRPDIWLAVSTADCLPVLISTPEAVAAIHAGWRGLRQGIVSHTIEKLMDEFSLDPSKIFISIGPCIRQHNYEVSGDFTQYFEEHFFSPSERKGCLMLDLPAVAIHQAKEAGALAMNISDAGIDTFSDKRFFSCRRSKQLGEKSNVQPSLIRRKR